MSVYMWTRDESQPYIDVAQQIAWQHGFHACLGGGVLTRGYSQKDLDMFFLPLQRVEHSSPDGLLSALALQWGNWTSIDGGSYPPLAESVYDHRVKFLLHNERRIDVFIVGDNPLVKTIKRLGVAAA